MAQTIHTQSILITGGSSGIGRAIAERFDDAKYKVAVVDKKHFNSERNVFFKNMDIGQISKTDKLYMWVKKMIGIPQVLVLNAGVGIHEKLTEGDPEKWKKIIDTNLLGSLYTLRAFVPEMMQYEGAHVFFVSSVAAYQPHPYGGVYSASKTALEIIAETLRLETLPKLKVTIISPGITQTSFFKHENAARSIDQFEVEAISPEEIAEDIFYCVNKRKGTAINKIVTRPINQNF